MKKIYFLFILFVVINSFGQGFETFTNSTLAASYSDGNFVGDNSVQWNFIKCRNELAASNISIITQPAILLRKEADFSAISALSGINGVGEISMKLYKAFSSTTLRQIDLYVNGNLIGTSPGFNDNNEHIYKVTGINVSGNVLIEIKNTKSVQIIVDDVEWSKMDETLSVVKNQIEGFVIYPNPVKRGSFRIMSSNRTVKLVHIYDMLGKKVLSKEVRTNEKIGIDNLNAGIYILKVAEDGKLATRKLIIE